MKQAPFPGVRECRGWPCRVRRGSSLPCSRRGPWRGTCRGTGRATCCSCRPTCSCRACRVYTRLPSCTPSARNRGKSRNQDPTTNTVGIF